MTLGLGSVQESFGVNAVAPALEAESSSIGELVSSNAVENLPLNGRKFIRLAQLVPGANESVQNAMSSGHRPDDLRRTSSLSVDGMRDCATNFMIDGMYNNERHRNNGASSFYGLSQSSAFKPISIALNEAGLWAALST